MEQCRANPCVFWKMDNKKVVLVLVVNVDDLLVSRNETVGKELLNVLNGEFSTQTFVQLEWYLGCSVERGWKEDTIEISQPARVDAMLVCFDVKHFFNIPAPPVAELGPTTEGDVVTDCPFRQAVGGVM